MANYTLPNGSVETLAGLFTYANEQSSFMLGNLILVSLFLIVLFRRIDIDGFKKRASFSFLICTLLGLLLTPMGFISGYIFGVFVAGSITMVLWVGFSD